MIEIRNRFNQYVDLNEDTYLTHLLDRNDTEDDDNVETQIIKHSPFYGQTKFADLIKKSAGLSILDLNIQNIFSKFDELVCFIQTINIKHPISVICLNECWIHKNMTTLLTFGGLHYVFPKRKIIKKFVHELDSMKIYDKLNQNITESQEDNYYRFAHLVNSARETHLPTNMVNYKKKKHNKSCWMTYGILESINNKNKLYKRFIQTDKHNTEPFNTLKNEYHIYRARLRRTIREAKRMFYTRTFLLYKNDMKK